MRKLTKIESEQYFRRFDPKGEKEWTVWHEPCTCPTGSSGFRSTYSCDNLPVAEIMVSNAHDFAAVYALQ